MSESPTPEFLDSKKVFAGRVFDVTVDTVREGDKTYVREVVHHPGSAVIIPVFDDGTIALVRQYRLLVLTRCPWRLRRGSHGRKGG